MHQPDVSYAYYYQEYNNNVRPDYGDATDVNVDGIFDFGTKKEAFLKKNHTSTDSNSLWFRADNNRVISRSKYWPPSQVSLPKGKIWQNPGSDSVDYGSTSGEALLFNYDKRAQSDQYVYVIGEAGVWTTHDVSSCLVLR